MRFIRFVYKGSEEQLPKVQAILDREKVTRKVMYLVLKYFGLTPDDQRTLEHQFPDV